MGSRRFDRADPAADLPGAAQWPNAGQRPDADPDLAPTRASAARQPWPPRALAATAAGPLVAWLSSHLLAPSPIGPLAIGALVAAGVFFLPRIGWLIGAATLAAEAALQHHPAIGLLLLLAALVPVLLMPLSATSWPLAGVALGLAAIGLGGAWPALAGRAGSAWRRAALAATGWIWLLLAGPIAGSSLYVGRVAGVPKAHAWSGSLQAIHDAIWPLLSSGAFLGAVVWALAAAALPWVVRRRVLALDVIRVVGWSALVCITTVAVIHSTHRLSAPSHVVAGAVAGALLALSPWIGQVARLVRESANV
jgi:hypothetical protein